MTQEELRKEVKDYLRQQTQLNGGGFVSLNINNLILGFAEKLNEQLTEANEIIKEYMRFEPMIGTCSFYSEEYEKTKKKAVLYFREKKLQTGEGEENL